MGFALWTRDGISWALGTHEYRPMGVAIVSATAQFSSRDFDPRRAVPGRARGDFDGFFASLGEMNAYLRTRRRGGGRKRPRRGIELEY